MSDELGKLDGLSPEQINDISRIIGLGALKYFILKVDPRKTMLFNPAESIDFNGNTGPFIQYTYARIKSLVRRANAESATQTLPDNYPINPKETELIKLLTDFSSAITEAAAEHSPAVIAAYVYELAKQYNQYYHDHPILKENVDPADRQFRLTLSTQVAQTIKKAMALLAIEVPERM